MIVRENIQQLTAGLNWSDEKWQIEWAESRGLKGVEKAYGLKLKNIEIKTAGVYLSPNYKKNPKYILREASNGKKWLIEVLDYWKEAYQNRKAIWKIKHKTFRISSYANLKRLKRQHDSISEEWLNSRKKNLLRFESAEREEQKMMEERLLNLMAKKMLD